jgi:DNA-binding protein HU-beta
MNKEELVAKIAKKTKLKQVFVNEILNEIFNTIRKTTAKRKVVRIGGFGTFMPVKRAARIGCNPKTGASVQIPAKTVPVFRASKLFKELVSKRDK